MIFGIKNKILTLSIVSFFFYFIYIVLVLGDTSFLTDIWNISTLKPIFADIRTITGFNLSVASGNNPLVDNIGDPFNRPMNYPAFWAFFAKYINMQPQHSEIFGLINLIFYFFGLVLFINKFDLDFRTSAVICLAVFSPASILAMERGNTDMIMFFLISIAILLYNKSFVFSLIIFIASVLKIFPVFAYLSLFDLHKTNRKSTLIACLFISLFTIYLFVNRDYFSLMSSSVPSPLYFAYGANIIWMKTVEKLGADIGFYVRIITYLYLFSLSLFIIVFFRKIKPQHQAVNETYLKSFQIGALIFMLTFLINNNWDYRLIFLIFTLPYLTLLMKADKLLKTMSYIAVFLILHTMWYLVIFRFLGSLAAVIDELLNWVLFTLISFIYANSLKAGLVKNQEELN